jgi:hypothetical protein
MTLLLYCYSWLLSKTGQVGKEQGNSNEDVDEWSNRVFVATYDVTTDTAAVARTLGVAEDLIVKMRADEWTEHIKPYETKVKSPLR